MTVFLLSCLFVGKMLIVGLVIDRIRLKRKLKKMTELARKKRKKR